MNSAPVHEAGAKRRPVRVVYITGWGHSGSTLLDLVLGTSGNVVSAGELVFLDFYLRRIHHRKVLRPFQCTCGAELRDCPFWRKVLGACSMSEPRIVFDPSNLQRVRWFLRFVLFCLRGKRTRPASSVLGDDAELLARVLETAGPEADFVCESSKDFARLIRLAMNPGIEVIPIHLVRDGRAVAHSYTGKKRYELGFKRTTYFASLVNWAVVNLTNILIFKLGRMPAVRVSYDGFCRRPDEYVRFLNRRLGLRMPEGEYLEAVNSGTYHNVGGNLLRFKRHEAIRANDRWREGMTPYKKLLAAVLLTNFLNRKWVEKDSFSMEAASGG